MASYQIMSSRWLFVGRRVLCFWQGTRRHAYTHARTDKLRDFGQKNKTNKPGNDICQYFSGPPPSSLYLYVTFSWCAPRYWRKLCWLTVTWKTNLGSARTRYWLRRTNWESTRWEVYKVLQRDKSDKFGPDFFHSKPFFFFCIFFFSNKLQWKSLWVVLVTMTRLIRPIDWTV